VFRAKVSNSVVNFIWIVNSFVIERKK